MKVTLAFLVLGMVMVAFAASEANDDHQQLSLDEDRSLKRLDHVWEFQAGGLGYSCQKKGKSREERLKCRRKRMRRRICQRKCKCNWSKTWRACQAKCKC